MNRNLLIAVFGIFVLLPHNAQANRCRRLYSEQKFVKAAQCFEVAADKIGSTENLSTLKRYAKGRHLKNATTCWLKAAQQKPAQSEQFKEKAYASIKRYLKEKLHENEDRYIAAKVKFNRLRRILRYGSLLVLAYDPHARICVKDRSSPTCYTGTRWEYDLHAGSYTLSVTYPSLSPIVRTVNIEADKRSTQTFFPPQTKVQLKVFTRHAGAKLRIKGAALDKPLFYQGSTLRTAIPPGTYKLSLTYPGSPTFSKSFHLNVGKNKTLSFNPPSNPLYIISQPPGAKVFINDVLHGTTPLQTLVSKGKHQLIVRKGCHRIVNKPVHADRQKVQIALQPELQYKQWSDRKKSIPARRTWGCVGVVGGLILGGVAVTGHVLASNLHAQASEQGDLYARSREQPEQYINGYQVAAESGNTWRTVGYVGI
ncbi:MAG: PEGA domain-containing protein, partial [Myxococcota bacterium]